MPRFSITLDDELNDYVDDLADSDEYESKSDAARALLRQGREIEELDDPLDELKDRADQADELKTENERLQRKLTEVNAAREEHQKLVEYVEREQTLQEQRLQASVFTRAKWWMFGKKDR